MFELVFGAPSFRGRILSKQGSGAASVNYAEALDQAPVYSIVYRLQTATTPERREQWMKKLLTMLAEGKTFHP